MAISPVAKRRIAYSVLITLFVGICMVPVVNLVRDSRASSSEYSRMLACIERNAGVVESPDIPNRTRRIYLYEHMDLPLLYEHMNLPLRHGNFSRKERIAQLEAALGMPLGACQNPDLDLGSQAIQ